MTSTRGLLASAAFLLSACSGSITFRSPVDVGIDLDAYSSSFRGTQLAPANSIVTQSCTQGSAGDAQCQALVPQSGAGSDIVVRCNTSNQCDPDVYQLVEDLGVQDLEELTSPQVSVIDRIELLRVEATRTVNSTNLDIPSFRLYWGSESSSFGTSTKLLATVPTIAQGSTGDLDISIDADGLDQIDDYIRNTSPKVRLFLVSDVDLEPNQAVPTGELEMSIGLIIRASGRLR